MPLPNCGSIKTGQAFYISFEGNTFILSLGCNLLDYFPASSTKHFGARHYCHSKYKGNIIGIDPYLEPSWFTCCSRIEMDHGK